MSVETDTIKLVNLDTGSEFTNWESAKLESDFLTPCDRFEFTAGAEIAGPDLAKKFPMGTFAAVDVNGKRQFQGIVKHVKLTASRNGTSLTVTGYDILHPLVRGNINPRIEIPKETTIADLVQKVVNDQFALPYAIFDNDNASAIAIGSDAVKKGKKYESRHKRDLKIKDIRPHDGEGAFDYVARILSHYGYWMWAQQDGLGVVIGGPDYEQTPAYTLVRKHDPNAGGAGLGNNILDATSDHNEESVPSHVFVRGSDAAAGAKGTVKAMAENPLVSYFVPAYIADRDASDRQKAETIARRFMAKQMRNWYVYECTVAGFSDPANGAIYNVNSVANVLDEKTGTEGRMWIESRTFEASRSGGKVTRLKLIPLGTLVLDWQPDETLTSVVSFPDAAATAGKEAPIKTGKFSLADCTFFGSH